VQRRDGRGREGGREGGRVVAKALQGRGRGGKELEGGSEVVGGCEWMWAGEGHT
jgi:hypothetical protein